MPQHGSQRLLNQISTAWSEITDVRRFVLRYAPAIQRYLFALLQDQHAVDDVVQEFLTRVCQKGFVPEQVQRGRFRDYLKAAVRNQAITQLRKHKRQALTPLPDDAGAPGQPDPWLSQWQQCLLDRSWAALEQQDEGRLYYTALRVASQAPEAASAELADKASAILGKTIRPDALRKQLSRARRMFAQALCGEVAQTLQSPEPDELKDELIAVGLWSYVEPYVDDPAADGV